ncbi:SKI complex subunit tetratricopeptide repeat protein SKI3 [Spizellomyces punctatus DAOM BR117]|uniref:PEP-CTERM system TPR-repeat lipoprotein n=1 Tax=Spizellomyces punctatus (strain DAOM BR117) TaxID=645134 RepID=A0A0L0HKV3_SPIPD|nr:SKI complex subunit tetratricopeptide repeat protein SKI3 [Spizellomyces punctatus DAOM BR117]KND01469.1 hypothetical protein SPPG_03271 [Spizellomyces punctatus DAOM BR117]|eukprot:XP_016609508.1 hypothetical protein SPPG_03271 [Spizellomyces punctatus DAOM BR117]
MANVAQQNDSFSRLAVCELSDIGGLKGLSILKPGNLMSGLKKLLKSAREELQGKNYEAAKEYCVQILDEDETNYNALVFLGLAEQNLRNVAESERAYQKAAKLAPSNPLAWQGLVNLYGETDNNSRLAEALDALRRLYLESKEGQKCLETTNKLIDLFERTNQRLKAIAVLKSLAPGTEYNDLCANLDLPSPLVLWQRIADLQEQHDTELRSKEVETRRRRLGADSLEVIRENVDKEVIITSQLEEIYDILLDIAKQHTEENQVYLEIGQRFVEFMSKKLPYVASEEKGKLHAKMLSLARAIIDQGSRAPLSFETIIDSQDVAVADYDVGFFNLIRNELGDSYLVRLASGYLAWRASTDNVDPLNDLLQGLQENPSSFFGYRVLGEVYVDRRDYDAAVECLNKAQELYTQITERTTQNLTNVAVSLELSLARAYLLLGSKTLPNALKLYKGILQRSSNNIMGLQGLGMTLSAMQKFDEAQRCFEKVLQLDNENDTAKAELGWIYYQKGNYIEALRLLREAIGKREDAVHLCWLGKVYWAMGDVYRTDKQFAHANWLGAAKRDPNYAPAFACLGQFYAEIEQDRVRAVRCYTRAVALDAGNEQAAKALSRMLLEDGQSTSAKGVLNAFVSKAQRAAWAYKQLGFIALANKEHIEAMGHFQTALRINSKDTHCWEGLGEAYMTDGKYMAALKAFGRGLELEAGSVSLNYQVAALKQQLGLYGEAVQAYRQSLDLIAATNRESMRAHIPTLKGLCESLLLEARQSFEGGAHGLCAQLLGEALETTLNAMKTTQLHSLAKILGDTSLAYKLLIPAYAKKASVQVVRDAIDYLEASLSASGQSNVADGDSTEGVDLLLRCATAAYKLAIQLCARKGSKEALDLSAGYWHDLALTYFYRHHELFAKDPEGARRERFSSYAVACEKKAIKKHPLNDAYWNALGVYTLLEDARVSQHALIKALESNAENPASWANLGLLYLLQEDLDLARQAFSRVQFADPEWPMGWFGLAIIAERAGKDALEFFEQAYELGGTAVLEVNYIYANYIYRHATRHRRRDSASYSTATLCLLKITQQRPDDWGPLNLLGLVLERQGIYSKALDAFDDAMRALQSSNIARLPADERKTSLRLITENRARVLCSMGRFSDSTAAYSEVLNTAVGDVYTQIGNGLALSFEERLPASLESFEKAFQIAADATGEDGTTTLPNDVTLILSQVLYALGSEQHQELAKQQLLSCVARDPRNMKALIGLCAFGLIRQDFALAQSAAAEIIKIPPDGLGELDVDADDVLSRLFMLQGNLKASKGFLSKAVHRYPWKAERWRTLAEFLYRHAPGDTSTLKTADAAVVLPAAPTSAARSSVNMTLGLTSLAAGEAGSGTSLTTQSRKRQRALQRAIRISPGNAVAWIALALQIRADAAVDVSVSENNPSESVLRFRTRCKTVQRIAEQAASVATFEQQGNLLSGSVNHAHRRSHLSSAIAWSTLVVAESGIARGEADGHTMDDLRIGTQLASNVVEQGHPRLQGYAYAVIGRGLQATADAVGATLSYKKAAITGLGSALEDLAQLYQSLLLHPASELCYRQSLLMKPSSYLRLRFSSLLRLTKLALTIANIPLANEAINEALKLNATSLAGRCLQALMYFRSGEAGKANKVLRGLDQAHPYVKLVTDSLG